MQTTASVSWPLRMCVAHDALRLCVFAVKTKNALEQCVNRPLSKKSLLSTCAFEKASTFKQSQT